MPKKLTYKITIGNSAGTLENLEILGGSIVALCKQEWIDCGVDPNDVNFVFKFPNEPKD